MKIVNRKLTKTADASAARGTAFPELRRLLLFTVLLVVGLYLCVALITDVVVARISFETEAKLFGAGLPSRSGEEEPDERLERPQEILDALVKDPQVPPLQYRLVYMSHDKPNAFAFPGGGIGTTKGLLDALNDDMALAFVLAHEIGHFHNRDHLRGVGRAIGVSVVFAIVFGGQMGSDSLGNMFHHVLERGYSRKQEEAADRFGVALVHRVYGKTEGVDRIFRLLRESDELPEWAYMFATHPSPSERIANLMAYADQLSGQYE